ncbi:MAG: dihydroneopterin aldolase, partial [Nitrospinota bacterium]
MSDMIKIEQLSAYCLIGIFDWERQVKQKVLIDIVLFSDIKNATQNDDIKYTANYKKITQAVLKEVENSEFYLIETLAEHLTSVILKYDNVNKVKITVSKPGAVKFTENVSVEIVRPSD